jgi:hypothetical protein
MKKKQRLKKTKAPLQDQPKVPTFNSCESAPTPQTNLASEGAFQFPGFLKRGHEAVESSLCGDFWGAHIAKYASQD